MPKVSRTSALIHSEFGPGEEHTGHLDDTTVNFVTINEDSDLAPLLVGLPDDKCQCSPLGLHVLRPDHRHLRRSRPK